jgi:flagellar biosynthesis chaperone FliJ
MSLSQLKTIRSQRVERGYTELQRIKAAFAQAEAKLQEAKDNYKNYCNWCIEQQKELFSQLQSGDFYPEKINQYHQKLEKLKEKELVLKEVIPSFEVDLKASFERLNEAKETLQSANKELEKVEEFIDMQKTKDKEEEEKQEEEVIDELNCFKSSRK